MAPSLQMGYPILRPSYLGWQPAVLLPRACQVEIWFNIITQKAICRGSFSSVRQLTGPGSNPFSDAYNPDACPLMYTTTADSFLNEIQRLCTAISGQDTR